MAAQPPGRQGLRPCPLPPDFKQRIARQFDARAPTYDDGNTYHPPQAARLVQLAALRPGEQVLDVGVGTGLAALAAAQVVGAAGTVTGVDLSEPMIQRAASKAQEAGLANVRLLAADVDECGFPEGGFDAILCSNALPFLPDIPGSLARWRRWLRPGGRLAFNAPKGVGSRAFTVFVEAAAEHGLLLRDPSAQFADEASVRRMLAAAGYSASQLSVSREVNLRAGQDPQAWAAAGWAMCLSMPFADMPALLGQEQLEGMRRRYLAAGAELAAGFATPEGVAEPYELLWVVATA